MYTKIIEYHEGCNVNNLGCFGPWNNFYTVFGTELKFLIPYIIISFLIGVILFTILFILNNKNKINLPLYLIILISLISIILLFFIFTYFFPIVVIY